MNHIFSYAIARLNTKYGFNDAYTICTDEKDENIMTIQLKQLAYHHVIDLNYQLINNQYVINIIEHICLERKTNIDERDFITQLKIVTHYIYNKYGFLYPSLDPEKNNRKIIKETITTSSFMLRFIDDENKQDVTIACRYDFEKMKIEETIRYHFEMMEVFDV